MKEDINALIALGRCGAISIQQVNAYTMGEAILILIDKSLVKEAEYKEFSYYTLTEKGEAFINKNLIEELPTIYTGYVEQHDISLMEHYLKLTQLFFIISNTDGDYEKIHANYNPIITKNFK